MNSVLISLGSNIDRERKFPAALKELASHSEIRIIAISEIFETPAIGSDGTESTQEPFWNAAAEVKTALSAAALRSELRSIEATLGRVRTADKFAARPMDLDIALYGDAVLDLEGSHIPDPDIVRFPHVAVPLANVAPDWIHPITGDTLRQIAERLATTEMERVRL